MGEAHNEIQLSATLLEKSPMRYTPAGIAVFEARMHHTAEVCEAGQMRRLAFDFPVIAFASVAQELSEVVLGAEFEIKGFVAPRSAKAQKLIVHITEFKFRS